MKKIICYVFGALLFTMCLTITAHAREEPITLPAEFESFLAELPDDIEELLPDELFEDDVRSVYTASKTLTDVKFLFNALLSSLGLCIDECIGLLIFLLAVIFISTVLHNVGKIVTQSSETLGFCVKLVIFSAIVSRGIAVVGDVQAYFSRLTKLTSACVPVMGVLYAMGGNVTSAAVNTEITAIFLSVCQYVNTSTVVPIFGLLLGLALVSAFSKTIRFNSLADTVKRSYTTFLGVIMTVIGIAMGLQSALAAKADGVAMKGVKYLISNTIPVVGGAISGAMSSIGSGIDLLRSAFGVSAIVILVLMILPILIKLILYKQVFEITAAFADMISTDGEGKLLRDISGLCGLLLAAASISSVILIIALVIFTNTTIAFA